MGCWVYIFAHVLAMTCANELSASAAALRFLRVLGFNDRDSRQLAALRNLSDRGKDTGTDADTLKKKDADTLQILRKHFVQHLLFAGRVGLLPVSPVLQTETRCGMSQVAVDDMARRLQPPDSGPDVTLDHVAMRLFVQPHLAQLPPKKLTCLEWAPIWLSHEVERYGLARCEEAWGFVYAKPYGIDHWRRELRADLLQADVRLPSQVRNFFDIIFCTFVLEHTEDPIAASKGLAYLLAPSGLLVLVTTFLEPFHGAGFWRHPDYFRFTPQGANVILKSAGFELTDLKVGKTGLLVSVGELLGLSGLCDFSEADLRGHLLSNAEDMGLLPGDKQSYFKLVMAIARNRSVVAASRSLAAKQRRQRVQS